MTDTVSIYDPTAKPDIHLTPAAIVHVKKEIAKHHAVGLRLGTKKAGCSGLKYVVGYVAKLDEPGEVVDIAADLKVYIDKDSLPMLRGIKLDYVREGLNGVLKFINPNETSSCGCGESFSV